MCVPDISHIKLQGYYPVDMHVHSNHSDGMPDIKSLIKHCSKIGTGLAITDHNEISGVIEAYSHKPEILIIPGIELESFEGPHLLFYFYTIDDLASFYKDWSKIKDNLSGFHQNPTVYSAIECADNYNGLKIAAHPYGYFGINRGVLKCTDNHTLSDEITRMDGIEVICGGMQGYLNKKAINYAKTNPVSYTGGSDAHIAYAAGDVITAVKTDSVEGFLDGIFHRQNIVIGQTTTIIKQMMTAGVIANSFLPFNSQIFKKLR